MTLESHNRSFVKLSLSSSQKKKKMCLELDDIAVKSQGSGLGWQVQILLPPHLQNDIMIVTPPYSIIF